MDTVLGELEPLESTSEEERWQIDEVVPVPIEVDPATNDGLCYKLISHIELQQQSTLSADADVAGSSGVAKPYGTAAVFHRVPNQDPPRPKTRFQPRKRRRKPRTNSDNSPALDLRSLISAKTKRDSWEAGNEKILRLSAEGDEVAGSSGDSHMHHDAPSTEALASMKQIVFLDLDNFQRLSRWKGQFPPQTYVFGFYGKGMKFKTPRNCQFYDSLVENNCFYLHPQCGSTKDAADFAICTKAGNLDNQLPKHIPFTVVSGDRGFLELKNQMDLSGRELHIVDPHSNGLDAMFEYEEDELNDMYEDEDENFTVTVNMSPS